MKNIFRFFKNISHTQQLLEWRFIVGHQIVNDDQPLTQGMDVHFEEC